MICFTLCMMVPRCLDICLISVHMELLSWRPMTALDGPGTRITTSGCGLFLCSTTFSSSSSSSSLLHTHLHMMCSLVHLLHAVPFEPARGSSHTLPQSMQRQQGLSVSCAGPFFPACLFRLGCWEPVLLSDIKMTISCTTMVSRASTSAK